MFNKSKRSRKKESNPDGEKMPNEGLTEPQRLALEKQQEQARRLRRLEAEWDLLGRRT